MEEQPSQKEDRRLDVDQQWSVLDAALAVLSDRGLQATFVEEVSGRSDIPVASIYPHFGGTQQLIETLLSRELELIAGAVPVPELRFPGETIQDELEVLARLILTECRNQIGFLRTLLGEAFRNPKFGAIFYRTFIVKGRQLFTEFLTIRQGRGELRQDVEGAAAFFLSALIFSLLLLELFGGKAVENFEDDRLVKSMSDVFLKGALQHSGLSPPLPPEP